MQITDDTRKYIGNVFNMLLFPWAGYGVLVRPYIKNVAKIIKNNYSSDLFETFCKATKINALMVHNEYTYDKESSAHRLIYDTLSSSGKTVFYGAGNKCKEMLETFKQNGLTMPIEIWDTNAENIPDLENISVIEPPFYDDCAKYSDSIVIITVEDKTLAYEITQKILRTVHPQRIFTYNETTKSIFYVETSRLRDI